MLITVTEHNKAEWSRLAQGAYLHGNRNSFGHRYSMAATLRVGEKMDLDTYDMLQEGYREWLINGFAYLI